MQKYVKLYMQKYAKNMQTYANICMKYAKNTSMQNMHRICTKYAKHMLKYVNICN